MTIPEIEGRNLAVFVDDPHYAEVLSDSPHEGWSNSSTWCFHLYFCQSRHWIEQLQHLVRKDGFINKTRLMRLLRWTQAIPSQDLNCQLDEWCEGPVNVIEFVKEFFTDYSGGKTFKGVVG
jgi:hypothetical protein